MSATACRHSSSSKRFEREPCQSPNASQAAAIKGTQNLAGMADPVIDALIDQIIAAASRPALVSACRALDRVIRSGRYWIPHWYKPTHWFAYWNVFARPAANPRYARGVPETWWYDHAKARNSSAPAEPARSGPKR